METAYKGHKITVYHLDNFSEVRTNLDGKIPGLKVRDAATGSLTDVTGEIAEGTSVVLQDPKTHKTIETMVVSSYTMDNVVECIDIRDK